MANKVLRRCVKGRHQAAMSFPNSAQAQVRRPFSRALKADQRRGKKLVGTKLTAASAGSRGTSTASVPMMNHAKQSMKKTRLRARISSSQRFSTSTKADAGFTYLFGLLTDRKTCARLPAQPSITGAIVSSEISPRRTPSTPLRQTNQAA